MKFHATGGMQIASTDAQYELLREFSDKARLWGHRVTLLDANETVGRNPILAGKGLKGSLFFHDDGLVSSRNLFHSLHPYLGEQGATILKREEATGITSCHDGVEVRLASGLRLSGAHCVLTLGAHAPLLKLFREASNMQSHFKLVKLQMMRLKIPPSSLVVPVTGSRTLLFYPLFRRCEAFAAMQAEFGSKELRKPKGLADPIYERWHIHNILRPAPRELENIDADYHRTVAQDVLATDEAMLGDSHEYAHVDSAHTLDDTLKEEITAAILQSASHFADALTRDAVRKQWLGYYEVPPVPLYHHRFGVVQTEGGVCTPDAQGRTHYVGLAGNGMTFGAAVITSL
jgi:hypothetical protein